MRINKFFTDQGYCSRRQADKLIEEKRVKINGRIAVLGDQVSETDQITLDGKTIAFSPPKTYIMYNKPRGITSTTDQRIDKNIIDAVKHSLRVFPIGRLDKDSTGLIFLTNDGDIVNKILRAQFGHEKEYVVEINRPVDDAFISKMSKGVDIGDYVTLPCKTQKIKGNTFSIILTEGKNRQIRRMCEALDAVVKNLQRIRIMNIKLGDLKFGEWRDIPKDQLETLKNSLVDTKAVTTPDTLELEE
ncbi:MAG: pseudouridine synthase [Oligoflexia bacterium]|nr:pseudouridine synthase [Oligoflexia bacterium]